MSQSAVAQDIANQTTQESVQPVEQYPLEQSFEESLEGMSYEEGRAALAPQNEDGTDPEARKKAFEEALSELIGGPLYDLIHEHLSTDQLNEYAQEGIGQLADAAKSLPTDKLGEAGPGAEKLAELALGWAAEKAEAWLEGSKGQDLLKAINDFVEEHPWVMATTAVTGALIGAVVLVSQNYDPDAFSSDFKIGDNFKGSAGLDIGPIQDLCLQGASLGLGYQKDKLQASVKGGWKQSTKDGETVNTYSAEAGLEVGEKDQGLHKASLTGEMNDQGDKSLGASYEFTGAKPKEGAPLSVSGSAKATVNADGDLSVEVAGALEKEGLKLDVLSSGKTPEEQVTEASLAFEGAKDHVLTGKYDHASGAIDLGVKRSWEESGLSVSEYFGTDGASLDLGLKRDNYSLNGGVKQDADGLQTGHFGFNAQADEWTVSSAAELDLDQSQLTKLQGSLGYKNESEAQSFLLNYSREWAQENGGRVPKDAFKAALQSSIAGVTVGASAGLNLNNGELTKANGSLSLSKDAFKAQLDVAMAKNTQGAFDTSASLALSSSKNGFEGLKFNYDHALDTGNDRYKTTLGLTGATDFGKFGLAGDLSASTFDGKQWDAKAGLVGSYDIGNNIDVLAGGEYERINGQDRWTAKAGVAVQGVPITVNYSPQNKQIGIGVSMTFDQVKSIFK